MKKATKIEEIPKIRCLSRRQEVKKATKKGKPSKIRCLSRRQEVKKATKIEEIPKIRCPSHAFPKKGYRIGELHQDAAPLFYILSAITAKVIFIQEKEKNIKFVKKCLRKIRLSFIIYMENVTKIKGIYYEGRKGYDEKKNT